MEFLIQGKPLSEVQSLTMHPTITKCLSKILESNTNIKVLAHILPDNFNIKEVQSILYFMEALKPGFLSINTRFMRSASRRNNQKLSVKKHILERQNLSVKNKDNLLSRNRVLGGNRRNLSNNSQEESQIGHGQTHMRGSSSTTTGRQRLDRASVSEIKDLESVFNFDPKQSATSFSNALPDVNLNEQIGNNYNRIANKSQINRNLRVRLQIMVYIYIYILYVKIERRNGNEEEISTWI